ncbi:hypothetical protein [Herbidospora yilanensis]|nr:hypothetical protein [Herbidospora yilanensis]
MPDSQEEGPGVPLARAVDHNGYRQPEITAYDKMGYLFHAIVPQPVIIE